MKKKIPSMDCKRKFAPLILIALPLFFILLLSNVIATPNLLLNLTHYYNNTVIGIDSIGSENLANSGASAITGKNGLGIDCDGGDILQNANPYSVSTIFTWNAWLDFDDLTGSDYIIYGVDSSIYCTFRQSVANTIGWRCFTGGTWEETTFGFSNTGNGYNMWTVGRNGTHLTVWLNASVVAQRTHTTTTNGAIGFEVCGGGGGAAWDGKIDEIGVWERRDLELEEIELLYNNGTGCFYENASFNCGSTPPPASDTTPPTITNINQTPSNLTVDNTLFQDLKINATITDNIFLVNSSIYMNTTLRGLGIIINQTNTSGKNNFSYSSALGSNYNFLIDEHYYLSATYNINPIIMEEQPKLNLTLVGANTWLKTRFWNLTNNSQQVFMEIYDENATSVSNTAEYYYCNDGYTTGNPISSSNCVLFASRLNNAGFNHTHSVNSKHKIFPMGINTDTGTLNGIEVSPTSYILKRGSAGGERVYYLNQITRSGTAQTSNNNGNTWSELSGTPDQHIHQFKAGETFSYYICASDNSSNEACSITYNDTIDLVFFPPNAVNIFIPESLETYTTLLNITHSESGSASGFNITGYKYEYASNDSTSFTLIKSNNYPNLNYEWDISSIPTGAYYLRVTITDSFNQTTVQNSDVFLISTPLTQDQLILQNIADNIESLGNSFLEGIDMLWLIIFTGLFIVIGIITKFFPFWYIGEMGIIIIGVNFILRDASQYNTIMAFVFMTIGVILIFVTTGFLLIQPFKERNKEDDFYHIY